MGCASRQFYFQLLFLEISLPFDTNSEQAMSNNSSVTANPHWSFTPSVPRGCNAPVVACSFPHTAALQRQSYFCPSHYTGFITLSPCTHCSSFLLSRSFFATSASICFITGSANTTHSRTHHGHLSFIYFKAQRGNPAEKLGTPWQLWHYINISSVFHCTFCTDG